MWDVRSTTKTDNGVFISDIQPTYQVKHTKAKFFDEEENFIFFIFINYS